MLLDVFTGISMLIGVFFLLIASIGLLRMPDLFLRMSATTKATTLGAGFMLVAAMIHFGNIGATTRALATICFLLLTAPVAAHMIGRAGYLAGTPLWIRTLCDDLKDRYDQRTHYLQSQSPQPPDTPGTVPSAPAGSTPPADPPAPDNPKP